MVFDIQTRSLSFKTYGNKLIVTPTKVEPTNKIQTKTKKSTPDFRRKKFNGGKNICGLLIFTVYLYDQAILTGSDIFNEKTANGMFSWKYVVYWMGFKLRYSKVGRKKKLSGKR